MKRFVCLILALLALSVPALALSCTERIDSDGNMCRECALGNFGADALRWYTGADIALFASGDLGITLAAGEITEQSLSDSFPQDKPIVVTEVTAEELRALLEESLSHITLGPDEAIDEAASAYEGFFCVAGFTYSYDASAPVGQRVYVLPLKGETLTLAISSEYASGDKVCTIREAVTAYCEDRGSVAPPEGDRIRVLGAWENQIVGGFFPKEFIIIVAAVAIIFGGARYRRRLNTER